MRMCCGQIVLWVKLLFGMGVSYHCYIHILSQVAKKLMCTVSVGNDECWLVVKGHCLGPWPSCEFWPCHLLTGRFIHATKLHYMWSLDSCIKYLNGLVQLGKAASNNMFAGCLLQATINLRVGLSSFYYCIRLDKYDSQILKCTKKQSLSPEDIKWQKNTWLFRLYMYTVVCFWLLLYYVLVKLS